MSITVICDVIALCEALFPLNINQSSLLGCAKYWFYLKIWSKIVSFVSSE